MTGWPFTWTCVNMKVSPMSENVASNNLLSIVEYLWFAKDASDNKHTNHEYTWNRNAIASMANNNETNASV